MNIPLIRLRPLEMTDKTQLTLLANNKKVWDNLRDYIPFPYSEQDADFFIRLTISENPQQNFGIVYDGIFCGVIGVIIQGDVYHRTGEIGYWIGEPFWSKGIATKAVELITTYAFEQLKLIRIHAGVFDFNVSSMRVLEKNGYEKEAIFRKSLIKNGEICDEHRYFQLHRDYR